LYERLLSLIPFIGMKLERYRDNSISRLSMLALIIIFAFNIIVVFVSLGYVHKRKLLEWKKVILILKINILSTLLIIICTNNLEFMRLYRPIEILNYSIMGSLAAYNRRSHKYRIKPIFYSILLMASGWLLCYRFIFVDHYEDVIVYVLNQNSLFR
jgi:formate hydrogenlyase subunit 3/multisubunit Na+/H+ antiporter MnhD subunit